MRKPLFGSPSSETSGTTRLWPPHSAARLSGTTPCCQLGSSMMRLVPPPPPYRNTPGGFGNQFPPLTVENPVPQGTSNRRRSSRLTPSVVPPADMTHCEEAGQSTVRYPSVWVSSPLSPEEKETVIPVVAACS